MDHAKDDELDDDAKERPNNWAECFQEDLKKLNDISLQYQTAISEILAQLPKPAPSVKPPQGGASAADFEPVSDTDTDTNTDGLDNTTKADTTRKSRIKNNIKTINTVVLIAGVLALGSLGVITASFASTAVFTAAAAISTVAVTAGVVTVAYCFYRTYQDNKMSKRDNDDLTGASQPSGATGRPDNE